MPSKLNYARQGRWIVPRGFVVQPWYYAEFICYLTSESSDFRQATERTRGKTIFDSNRRTLHCGKYLHKLTRNNLIYIWKSKHPTIRERGDPISKSISILSRVYFICVCVHMCTFKSSCNLDVDSQPIYSVLYCILLLYHFTSAKWRTFAIINSSPFSIWNENSSRSRSCSS